MINEWGKFEEKIIACDFDPKNVCYKPTKLSEIDISDRNS